MLIKEIIELTEAQSDESYSIQEWVELINMGLDDLSPFAKNLVNIYGKPVVVSGGEASIVMSTDSDLKDLQEVRKVFYTPAGGKKNRLRKLAQGDDYSTGWKVEADKLFLQGLGSEVSGEINLALYKNLPHIAYDSAAKKFTPASPPQPLRPHQHHLLVLWLCTKSQQREEEAEDKRDFQREYDEAKSIFSMERMKEMEPGLYLATYGRAVTSNQQQ